MRFLFIITFIAALGCSPNSNHIETQKGQFIVLTTTQMLADAIRPHLSDSCTIDVLFPQGVDPHSYRPVPSDVQRLQRADAIAFNGLHLEANMESMFDFLSTQKPCISIAQFVPKSKLIPLDEHVYDPHIWFDILLFGQAGKQLADSLAKALNPTLASPNTRFMDSLIQLDLFLRQSWAKRSKPDKSICSVHDAFSYYCRAYQLTQMSLQGVSTTAEFGVYEVDAMVEFLVKNNIRVAYTEVHSMAKTMKAVQLGCRQRGHAISIGPPLLTDAPAPGNNTGNHWPGMVLENSRILLTPIPYD